MIGGASFMRGWKFLLVLLLALIAGAVGGSAIYLLFFYERPPH